MTHTVVPQKRVLFLRNTPVDLSIVIVVLLQHSLTRCGISATPSFCCIFATPQVLRISQPDGVSPGRDLFEGLWASLNLIEAIEPHWSHWTHWRPTVPLNPLDRSYSRNLMLDPPGSVRSVPKYANWSHTDVLGTWLSMCSDRCPPQRPPVICIYIIHSHWPTVNRKWGHFSPDTTCSGGLDYAGEA